MHLKQLKQLNIKLFSFVKIKNSFAYFWKIAFFAIVLWCIRKVSENFQQNILIFVFPVIFWDENFLTSGQNKVYFTEFRRNIFKVLFLLTCTLYSVQYCMWILFTHSFSKSREYPFVQWACMNDGSVCYPPNRGSPVLCSVQHEELTCGTSRLVETPFSTHTHTCYTPVTLYQ